MSHSKRVAIIIPAYNESKVIGSVITSLPTKLNGMKLDIYVIDDGSIDNTAEVASKAGAQVVRHLINTGAGGASATGLQIGKDADYDYLITMDADGQHATQDCLRVLAELQTEKFDLVIGSRLVDSTGMPRHRVIGNKGLNFITYLIFRTTVSDTQSGLKGFTRNALQRINIKSSGMEFCSEIIWRAKQQGLIVAEVPIQAIYTDYSMAKGQSNWNALSIIKNLIKRKLLEIVSV